MIIPTYPFRVEFEVVSTCNLNCVYCYAKPFNNIVPQLDNIKYLLQKTKEEANPFEIVLLGGEPFLRNDMITLLEFTDKLFVDRSIGVSTNGTLFSRLPAKELNKLKDIVKERPVIQISLDSSNYKINDKTRKKTNLTLDGLNTLEKQEIRFSIGIMPTTANILDIPNTVSYLLNNYAYVKQINIETLQPTFSINFELFNKLALNSQEVKKLRKNIALQIKNLNRSDVIVTGLDESCTLTDKPITDTYNFQTCMAGLFRAGVFVNGDVTPCVLLRDVRLGNLYTESWKNIWINSKKRFLSLRMTNAGQCTALNLLRRTNKDKLRSSS